jgi:hypothetical protein
MKQMHRIDDYHFRFGSSRSTTDTAPVGFIFLFSGDEYVGGCFIYHDGVHLPEPALQPDGRIELHYSLCQLLPVMEMLRSERQVFLCYDSEGVPVGSLDSTVRARYFAHVSEFGPLGSK